MNPYTSVITSMEGELQELDQRRAKLIAALGSLRALDKAHGYKSTTALRHHMTPLLTAGRVVETGKAAALRFSLPVAHEPAPIRLTSPPIYQSANKLEDLETVWDGSKGSPSLTSGVAGMGSSLSGTQYEVGRRLR